NNLALISWQYDGPQAALDLIREGIEFCQRRGLTQMAEAMAAARAQPMAELGYTEETLEEAAQLADRLELSGDFVFAEPRSVQLRLLVECGRHGEASSPEPMLRASRDSRQPEIMALAVAAAANLLHAQAHHEQARLLLADLDLRAVTRTNGHYATLLPSLVRTALNLTDSALATSLNQCIPPLTPLHQHALTTSHAQLSEADENYEEASSLYAEAARRWQQFGNVPEHAYALLGQGRCLNELGDTAEQPLHQAAELFALLGYKPAFDEAKVLLSSTQPAAN